MASRSEIARQDQASEQRRADACANIIAHTRTEQGDWPDGDHHSGLATGVLSALAEAIDAEAVDVRELRRKGWQSAAKTLDETAIVVRGWRDLLIEYTPPNASALPTPAPIAVDHRAGTPAELEERLTAAFGAELAPTRHIRTVIEPKSLEPGASVADGPAYGNLCGATGGSFTHPGGANCADCHLTYAEQNDGKPYAGPGHVDVAALLAGRPEVLSFPFEVPADAATQSMDASALARIDSLPDGYGMINVTVEAGQTYAIEGATVRRVVDGQGEIRNSDGISELEKIPDDGPATVRPDPADDLKPMHPAELAEHRALDLATGAPGGYVVDDPTFVDPFEQAAMFGARVIMEPRMPDDTIAVVSDTDAVVISMPTVIEPVARRPARMRLTAAQVREHGLARQRGADHRSVSQVTGFADCGTRAALSDLERPAWWNVGGKAFHACAEEINRWVADGGDLNGHPIPADERWLRHFDAQIVEQCAATPDHHPDTWRAANRGSEHYDWWRVEGPAMVQKYVVWLSGMIAEGWRIATASAAPGAVDISIPVIEFTTRLDVGLQVPNLSIIDLALIDDAGRVIIIDLKAGNAPKDTFQLGVYGWCALAAGIAQQPAQVRGAYYRARRGELTAPMPVLDMHPWPDVVQRYRDQDAMERQGIYLPNVTSFCGGCGVRDLCPAQSDG